MIDLERGELYPGAAALDRLLEWTAPARADLGLEVTLPALNGAQRQRRMSKAGMTPADVYATMVGETRDTYAPVEVTECGR